MARLNWSDQSIADLISISDFIAKDSIKFAKITIDRIRASAKKVRDYPMIGRIVPEMNLTEIREMIIGNYRLIYFIVDNEQIDILSVYHSSRSLNIHELKKHIS